MCIHHNHYNIVGVLYCWSLSWEGTMVKPILHCVEDDGVPSYDVFQKKNLLPIILVHKNNQI